VFFKRRKKTASNDSKAETQTSVESDSQPANAQNNRSGSIEQGLSKTRRGFFTKLAGLVNVRQLDDDAFDELEDTLISSDAGVDASLRMIENLRAEARTKKIDSTEELLELLARETMKIMNIAEQPWQINAKPYVCVVVGVNGVGKTTTTAKIAAHLQAGGSKVMLAAADTFRAAAVEQLQQWGTRLNIPVITQGTGSDAAAVAHDAVTAAKARDIDVLLIDTAGRLHTQNELMEQLSKIMRVLSKQNENYPHEVLQVLDAGTGQNALSQVEHFQKATAVSSLALTKLDGSAKGGVAIALTQKFGLPIRFIGVGEQINDLKPFTTRAYVEALFGVESVEASSPSK
jgi:fused signal recognition particle receptor